MHMPLDAPAPTTLVIGCGNPLRGDDAVGIEVVRRLAASDLPAWVRCVDAGTSGLEVILAMREADQVVLIDAAATPDDSPSRPGTLHELAPECLSAANADPGSGISTHAVRWDQALALARALAGERLLPAIRCFLIEGNSFGYGEPLSPPVAAAAERLAGRLAVELCDPGGSRASHGGS